MSYVWQRFGCEATRLIRDKKINPWDEKEPIEKEKKRKKGGKAGACKTPVGVTKLALECLCTSSPWPCPDFMLACEKAIAFPVCVISFETPGESSGDEGLIVVIVLTVVEDTSDISHYRRTGLASPGAASLEALRGPL